MEALSVLAVIGILIFTVINLIIYHKVFTVTYFNLSKGCFTELFYAWIVAMFEVGLIVLLGRTVLSGLLKVLGFAGKLLLIVLAIALAVFVVSKIVQIIKGKSDTEETGKQDVDFVAGQFDISVADGSEIVDARMSGNSHSLYRFDNSESTRFIVASMENASIDMVGGNLLIIQVRGNAAPTVEGAIFTDATAKAYHLNATGTSGIEGVNAENGTMQRIYNAAGQAMRAIRSGINIIRHSDGTTTKELHK